MADIGRVAELSRRVEGNGMRAGCHFHQGLLHSIRLSEEVSEEEVEYRVAELHSVLGACRMSRE